MKIPIYILKQRRTSKRPYLEKVREVQIGKDICLNAPESVVHFFNGAFDIASMAEEYAIVLYVDNKNKPLGVAEISHGTCNSTVVNTREIFIRALLVGAAGMFITHNHPSGSTEPSKADIAVTEKILDACRFMGISLIDHIIIGKGFYSFSENNRL